MSNRNALALGALVLALAACGKARDDSLADGAVDRPQDGESAASAQDVGPPTVPSAAAGPASARTGPDASVASAAPAAGSAATGSATLKVANGGPHGAHVVDSGGIALYLVEGDRAGEKCVGDCLKAWPPVLVGAVQPSGETGLQGAMISTTTRPDGARQVTYNGQPLYRYAADGGAGKTNGHGVKDQYGTWYLVSPQGAKVATHAGH